MNDWQDREEQMRLTQRECDILRAENKRLICRVSELEHENGRLEGAIEGLVGEEFRQANRAVKAEVENAELLDALVQIDYALDHLENLSVAKSCVRSLLLRHSEYEKPTA
jgi:DNA-directed RNA polymerase subunit N (RpoN/RPB10)